MGTVVEVKQMSVKDRLERKKYMGVWRRVSELMARIMSRFPTTQTRYIDRNSQNKIGCSSSLENPRRMNFAIVVWFLCSM
jgi:hypothetical protein